ncbi:MAG: diguanylate cyclase [Cohaesibacteraceae bacterium]|nr:diguanylate cyclase [Cohaesibacteraceae bacterium]
MSGIQMIKAKAYLLPFMIIFGLALGLFGGLQYIFEDTVQKITKHEAEHKAREWAQYFNRNIPFLDKLIQTGIPSQEQSDVINKTVLLGDVFRFKLFTPEGRISLVSDELDFLREQGASLQAVNPKALNVYKTGFSHVEVHDGSQKVNRPDIYVEAYVPAVSSTGEVRGVLEVYVDQTASIEFIRQNFANLAFYIPLICALVFLVPACMYVGRYEKLMSDELSEYHLSEYDPSTGVYNRGAFAHKLEVIFNARMLNRQDIGIVFVAVDDFRSITEVYGLDGADKFLCHVAQILSHTVRESDLTGRHSGHEFIITLPDIDRERLDLVMDRVLTDLHVPMNFGNKFISSGFHVGAHLSTGHQAAQDALVAAEIAKVLHPIPRDEDPMNNPSFSSKNEAA